MPLDVIDKEVNDTEGKRVTRYLMVYERKKAENSVFFSFEIAQGKI